MHKKIYLMPFFLLLWFANQAQKKYPSTLLWRISGKGLKQPSYLFGTMHLQDRRIFHFGDSVYHAIEKTEGFAMEINPNEALDSMFTELNKKDTSVPISKVLSKKEYEKYAKKLEKKFDMPASQITIKKLAAEKTSIMYRFKKPDDMSTVVDLYLYGIAGRLGKWTGGVEEIGNHFSVLDELGKDFKISDLFIPEDSLKAGLEWMVKKYSAQDLDAIEKYSGSYDTATTDKLLTGRNKKMMIAMDSLMQLRSMFFAVGVAHLPGKDGLLELVKENGFTVEPVFSSRKIAPEQYSYPDDNSVWQTLDKPMYSIEMPGKASPFNINKGMDDAMIYADLVTNVFYLTGTVKDLSGLNPDSAMLLFAKNMGRKVKVLKKSPVTSGKIKGIDVLIADSDKGIFFQMNLFFYNNIIHIAVAGSEVKERLEKTSVKKFFSSFKVKEWELVQKKKELYMVKDSLHAFLINFPSKPEDGSLEVADSTLTAFRYYLWDENELAFYQVVVYNLKKGFYLSLSDTGYFNLLVRNYQNNKQFTVKDTSFTKMHGWPAMIVKLEQKEETTGKLMQYTAMMISRGNRSYLLLRGGYNEIDSSSKLFFNSFKPLIPDSSQWHTYTSTDSLFTTWLPEKPELKGEEKRLYLAYDRFSSNSFYVEKSPLPKYYWKESDSAFWEEKFKMLKNLYDTAVEVNYFSNAGSNGIEYIHHLPGKYMIQHGRMLLNGDTLFTLFTALPEIEATHPQYNSFFNNFRFNKIYPSSVTADKSVLLLNDLSSKDTSVFEAAREALSDAPFTDKHTPLLKDALTKNYIYDDAQNYSLANEEILNKLSDLCKDSCTSFYFATYQNLRPSFEKLKYPLIAQLAKIKTEASFAILKQLLLNNPPSAGNVYPLIYALRDSLQLTSRLFPDILEKSNDSIFGMPLMYIARGVIDSGYVKKEILNGYEDKILQLSAFRLKEHKKNEDSYNAYEDDLIEMLERLATPSSIAQIRKFLGVENIYIKKQATLSLLKLKQNVPAAEIQKIAADKSYRHSFYVELKKIKQEKLFPVAYRTQAAMAESLLFSYAQEYYDDTEAAVSPLGERLVKYKGKQIRVYLFKVTYEYEEEKESYLGICGPFSLNKLSLDTEDECTGIYDDKPFSAKQIDVYLKKYLKQLEEEED
jgi:uncharacterized protein YbaP (TraB family)